MDVSRRSWLKRIGAVGTGAVLSSSLASAATKPSVDWRPADSSNYTNTSRTAADIDWVVVHTIEGSDETGISVFQDPDSNVSAHYVVGDDGYQAQCVYDEDEAWHAGNSDYNAQSIGIEHGGYASQSSFPDVQYQASAEICAYVCDAYDIPKEHVAGIPDCNAAGGGIIGHDQVPDPYNCSQGGGASNHTDPGDNWDWDYYMELVGGTNNGGGGSYSWPTYSYGDQAEAVYSIQYLLEDHGYALQYHDGIYGSEVESTVEQFQADTGLAVDGICGPNTWEQLYVVVSGPNDDPYWATYGAQHHLKHGEGYSIAVDGYYGAETEGAIEDFQSSAGLTVDGVVGHDTWQALVDI
ncbi:N-acetylmuramoyl-L-alanine amidase [Haladaptatus sp. DYSN1]|uniref:peptidoglycan recognition protein family protein n=1 Tax=unclassified Haladaptatus TaxID=2622732 RepID=UPI002405FD91|nr:N-acetylmuramoyl-L-alanine amidase [Haladaptatus sp. DYSN1]